MCNSRYFDELYAFYRISNKCLAGHGSIHCMHFMCVIFCRSFFLCVKQRNATYSENVRKLVLYAQISRDSFLLLSHTNRFNQLNNIFRMNRKSKRDHLCAFIMRKAK